MKNIKKILYGVAALGAIASPIAAAVSCGGGAGSKFESEIAFTNYSYGDSFMQTVQAGIVAQGKDLKTTVGVADAQNSQDRENSEVEAQINGGAKGLLVNLVSPSAASVIINQAKTANLPLVLVNKEPENKSDMNLYPKKMVYVGSKPSDSGVFQADLIFADLQSGLIKNKHQSADANEKKIDFVILGGQKPHADAKARTRAVCERLVEEIGAKGISPDTQLDTSTAMRVDDKGHFHLKAGVLTRENFKTYFNPLGVEVGEGQEENSPFGNVVTYVSTTGKNDWSVLGGQAVAENLFTQHKEVDFVAGNNDDTALGAVTFYTKMQTPTKSVLLKDEAAINAYITSAETNYQPVYGIDANDAAIISIKEGGLSGTVKQDGNAIGRTALQAIYNLVHGKPVTEGFASNVVKDADGDFYRVPYQAISREVAKTL